MKIQVFKQYYYPLILLFYSTFVIFFLIANNSPLLKRFGSKASLPFVFVAGLYLRFIYLAYTPYRVRGHDVIPHLDYIRYVAEHFAIPPRADGWQFYQPPLYYFLSAIWFRIGEGINRIEDALIGDLQLFAFVISLAVLGIAIWIGRMLFNKML